MFLASCQKLQASSLRSPEISRGTARMDYDRNLRSKTNVGEAFVPRLFRNRSGHWGPSQIISALESTEPGDVAPYGQSMNIMGTFVGGDRLEVHQMPDHRITIGDAHGAE